MNDDFTIEVEEDTLNIKTEPEEYIEKDEVGTFEFEFQPHYKTKDDDFVNFEIKTEVKTEQEDNTTSDQIEIKQEFEIDFEEHHNVLDEVIDLFHIKSETKNEKKVPKIEQKENTEKINRQKSLDRRKFHKIIDFLQIKTEAKDKKKVSEVEQKENTEKNRQKPLDRRKFRQSHSRRKFFRSKFSRNNKFNRFKPSLSNKVQIWANNSYAGVSPVQPWDFQNFQLAALSNLYTFDVGRFQAFVTILNMINQLGAQNGCLRN